MCNRFSHTLIRLQKKILRCIKFQPSATPSAPLFHTLKIMKLDAPLFHTLKIVKLDAPLFHTLKIMKLDAPLFHILKIVKLEDMLHLSILSFVYKTINKLSPICFHDYFTPDSSIHRFGNRQATRGDLYIALKITSLYGLKTVQYFGSKLWNTLPLFIRIASYITVSRSKLRAYVIDSYVLMG